MTVALLSHSTVFAEENSRSLREIQQALSDAGFSPGKPDGVWGKKSISASLQNHGLSQSGIHPSRAAGFWAPRVVTSVHGDR
jgi:peptidoglycan hydrolase-like protein with peptidoglycan-binding domain